MVRDQFENGNSEKFNLITRIFSVIFLFISVFFMFRVSTSSMLPAKFFYLVLAAIIVFNFIFLHIAFKRRTSKLAQLFIIIFYLILSLGLIFANAKLSEVSNFIKENFDEKKSYSVYNVIVNKDSKANSLSDIKGAELFTYEEPVKEISNDALKQKVSNVISDSTLVFKEDLETVMERPLKMLETPSVVNNGTYESYLSVNEDYEQKIKIIGEIKIEITGKVDNDQTDAKKETIASKPFLLFINGIDTRTGTMPSRSLSDVNILAAVNPETKKNLLVAIPRDTYVQLHGTTGLMDKLTHSGSRGGIDLTVSTVEDLFDLEIDRYIRVNFNFVTDLVDNIGGITVTNDLDHALTLDGCVYKPGDNAVDGKCALRFARERKSYSTGDRHRGENQEQVISRIVEKIQNDKNLLTDYGKILNALNGSFDTNFTSDDITALVRMQLDDMKSWSIESYNINGTGKMTKTYSYPNQNLYVMMPNLDTINTAKSKITEILK
ncbi:LCP family protein [Candidatus Saccharibacteria bacterium]|nr:LCP family protein [Candidatus Saccharibacteria bacterium]